MGDAESIDLVVRGRPDELEAQAVQEEIGSAVGDGDGSVGSESGKEEK